MPDLVERITMAELIPINIVIGDRTYRIRTQPEDEEKIRATLKTVNDKIIEFKTQFAGKDMQDYIAMVMIWYATQSAPPTGKAGLEELGAILQKWENAIDKVL